MIASTVLARPTLEQVREAVRLARELVAAHERRYPGSDFATLAEEQAFAELREYLR